MRHTAKAVIAKYAVSIHAPTRGATSKFVTLHLTRWGFNPRTHTGCDIFALPEQHEAKVSIHAPTRGATFEHTFLKGQQTVSIHAPTRGATQAKQKFLEVTLSFQSTHPHGVRHAILHQERKCEKVSIHAPTRGATRLQPPAPNKRKSFNPRTHTGCDLEDWQRMVSILVSIHAPTRGAT